MGRDGRIFKTKDKGLMKLFGTAIDMDRRPIAAFTRNISVISTEQFETMLAPSLLTEFPQDLANSNLFYSGIYEDGWISPDSYLYLTHLNSQNKFVLKGFIPLWKNPNYSTILVVKMNHKIVATKKLVLGDFDINIPAPKKTGKIKISIHFTNVEFLHAPDNRPIGAKIIRLGFI